MSKKVEETDTQKIEWCQSCGKNKAEELHTCPYKEEMTGNVVTLCNCCKVCEHECCLDI